VVDVDALNGLKKIIAGVPMVEEEPDSKLSMMVVVDGNVVQMDALVGILCIHGGTLGMVMETVIPTTIQKIPILVAVVKLIIHSPLTKHLRALPESDTAAPHSCSRYRTMRLP
jgi:hypothetical protein